MRFGHDSQPLSALTFEEKLSFGMPVFLAPKKYHYFSAPGALKDCVIGFGLPIMSHARPPFLACSKAPFKKVGPNEEFSPHVYKSVPTEGVLHYSCSRRT